MINPRNCRHETLIPLEFEAGKKVWPNGEREKPFKNYSEDVTILGAHYIRVTSYYCPLCGSIIKAPKGK